MGVLRASEQGEQVRLVQEACKGQVITVLCTRDGEIWNLLHEQQAGLQEGSQSWADFQF